MKHIFSSGKSDDADATLVRPVNWNDVHVHGITSVSGNTTLNTTHDYVRGTGGAGGITITLPAAAGQTGRVYLIKKVDSAAGSVIVEGAGAETIGGLYKGTIDGSYCWDWC